MPVSTAIVRDVVIKTLLKRTNEKNAKVLEGAIFNCMKRVKSQYNIEDEDSRDFTDLYKEHSYNFLGILMDPTLELKDCLKDLKENKLGWDCYVYDELRARRETENIRATRPTSITDGIYKCYKCSCKKIVSYSLQLRSGDEPMTHFFICTQCACKWRKG